MYESEDGRRRRLFENRPRRQPKRQRWKGRSVYHKGIQNRVSIHDKPEVINQKKQFGYWEFDVVEGKAHKGGMVTALERVNRFYQVKLLPSNDSEYGVTAQLHILRSLSRFARKTATFDNGKENYNHTKMRLTELHGEELNVDALLNYAYIYIRTVESVWYDAPGMYRVRLQRIIFPKGVDYGKEGFSNTEISPLFKLIELLGAEQSNDVTPPRFELGFTG